jgi:hypothetical protein
MGFSNLVEFSMTKMYPQYSISFAPLSLKNYKITSIKSYSLSVCAFERVCPNYTSTFPVLILFEF